MVCENSACDCTSGLWYMSIISKASRQNIFGFVVARYWFDGVRNYDSGISLWKQRKKENRGSWKIKGVTR